MSDDDFSLDVPDRVSKERTVWITIDARTGELVLLTDVEWRRFESRVRRVPPFPRSNRHFVKALLGYAARVSIIGKRVVVPRFIFDAAGLNERSHFVDRGRYCAAVSGEDEGRSDTAGMH